MERILIFYLIMIVSFSAAISGFFASHHRAEAVTQNTITGSGWAAPVLADFGDFACSSSPDPAGSVSFEVHFTATQMHNKTLSGVWFISVFEETGGHILGGEQHGTLNGGRISSAGYNLTGEMTFDNLCLNPVPSTVNITGQCAPLTNRNPNVEFRAASGETGSFLADVFCSP